MSKKICLWQDHIKRTVEETEARDGRKGGGKGSNSPQTLQYYLHYLKEITFKI